MKLKHQMDVDEQFYIDDFTMGDTGLANNRDLTNIANLPAGAKESPRWSLKPPRRDPRGCELRSQFGTAGRLGGGAQPHPAAAGELRLYQHGEGVGRGQCLDPEVRA
jgi:hypothetical protein